MTCAVSLDSARLPSTFQRLTEEDQRHYGVPAIIELHLPEPQSNATRVKLANWLAWRAAPYPADRHSEYLYRSLDGERGPKILLSAVMSMPPSLDVYLEQFPSKRRYDIEGRKARHRGYSWREIAPVDHAQAIRDIIHSSTTRQGRAIAAMFSERPRNFDFSGYTHTGETAFDDLCVGVFSPDDELVAYLLGKRVGDHVQYDEIMGHADHLPADVMYLLHIGFLELCMQSPLPPSCLHYGPWYSGDNPFSPQGGLNRWKRKVKFTPAYLVLASC